MAFYLICKDATHTDGPEYRVTGYITDTHAGNHARHGWRVVQRWTHTPTMHAITEATFNDSQASGGTDA